MHLAIQLVSDLGAGGPETREVASIDRPDDRLAIDDLGLTIAETKAMLAALQAAITDAQVLAHVRRERPCPCCGRARRLKDRRNITVRTCFGKLALASPRFARCSCEAVPGIAAPLVAALPERVTPDLLALEARWASLAAYGVSAALIADVLPIGAAVNAATIRNDVTKRHLRRGVFRSVVDLQTAINRFVAEHNAADPKPFRWTADPDKILAAVRRGHQVLDLLH